MPEAIYELWETEQFLATYQELVDEPFYWTNLIYGGDPESRSIYMDSEYIDFEKLPAERRKIAPLVKPLGVGKGIYESSTSGARFKPAYLKMKDSINPLDGLRPIPGLDPVIRKQANSDPIVRRNLLRANITGSHVRAFNRRMEWLTALAIRDAKYTLTGEEYPTTLIDFQRAANQTVVLTAGSFWGDSGVDIFASIQTFADRMFNAPFGAFPSRITMGNAVWAVISQSDEFMKHMDLNYRGGAATIERGIIGSGKSIKVGELLVGGVSGAAIELYKYADTYLDPITNVETPYLASTDIVMTAPPTSINVYQTFGRIIDVTAQYEAMRLYPRNWLTPNEENVMEFISHQSAPLVVPINPNATLRATVVAA